MSWRKVHVLILDDLGFEALCVTKPDLPLTGPSLDGDTTWIDLGLVNEFSAKRARPIEFNFWWGLHHLTRTR